MPRIAFMTFGVMVAPPGTPEVEDFEARLEATFEQAASMDGYIDRGRKPVPWLDGVADEEQDWGAWGPYRRTAFYRPALGSGDDREASTLSLWRNLESVRAFAYGGLHRDALRLRAEWFLPRQWPSYVAWWVADHEVPSWAEAAGRLEHLHAHGPSAFAFDFRHAFDADGAPVPSAR